MQTVNASVILEDAERLLGWDIDQLETREKQMARSAFSLALQEVWESWWWEQLMLSAAIAGATVYAAGTAFAADAFCYFPATQKFYQAMQATTGNAPATLDSTTGSYVTNYVYWAEAVAAPGGADYKVGENDAGLAIGSILRSLSDGEFYQLFSYDNIMVVSNSGRSDVDGIYTVNGESQGKATYINAAGIEISWSSLLPGVIPGHWTFYDTANPGGGDIFYSADTDVDTPNLAQWTGLDIVANLYGAPGEDAAAWHKLIPFTPSVSINHVRAVGYNDLRNSPNPGQVDFEATLDGIRIPGWDTGVPWLWYRRPTPVLDGDEFDASLVYTATPTVSLTFD